jgi:hypothetical protein
MHLCVVAVLLTLIGVAVPVFAADIDCRDFTDECQEKAIPCGCDLVTPVQINGSQTATVDTVYSASAGRPPYSWSFNGGSIDSSGRIISITECGPAGSSRGGTVSVTDSCGASAELAILLPGGVWALPYPLDVVVCFVQQSRGVCTEDLGDIQNVYDYGYAGAGASLDGLCPGYDTAPCGSISEGWPSNTVKIIRYAFQKRWQCF